MPLTSVSCRRGRSHARRGDRVRHGVVSVDAHAAVDPQARTEVERVEQVQGDRVGAAVGSRAVGTMFMPTTGLKTSGRLRSMGARVPTPASVGANWLSVAISRPALKSWRSLPVVARAVRCVWFEKMSLCRSLACRLSVTRFVAGLYAAGIRDARDDRLSRGRVVAGLVAERQAGAEVVLEPERTLSCWPRS